jgi:hypothetical protein
LAERDGTIEELRRELQALGGVATAFAAFFRSDGGRQAPSGQQARHHQ